jgi:hypothetical protein
LKANFLVWGDSTLLITADKLGKIHNLVVPSRLSKDCASIGSMPEDWKLIEPNWLNQ